MCEELRQEPGIDAVTLGRQVQERRTVSQARHFAQGGNTCVAELFMLLIYDSVLVYRVPAALHFTLCNESGLRMHCAVCPGKVCLRRAAAHD